MKRDFAAEFKAFMKGQGIRHIVIEMEGTKKVEIPEVVMHSIMEVALNEANHPLLIHCNHGKVCLRCYFDTCDHPLTVFTASNWLRCSSHPARSRLDSRFDRQRVPRLCRTQGSRLRCQVHHGIRSLKTRRSFHSEETKPWRRSHQRENVQVHHWHHARTLILDHYSTVLGTVLIGVQADDAPTNIERILGSGASECMKERVCGWAMCIESIGLESRRECRAQKARRKMEFYGMFLALGHDIVHLGERICITCIVQK